MCEHAKHVVLLTAILSWQICSAQPAAEVLPVVQSTGKRSPLRKEVDRLQDQQRYQEALRPLEQILEQARKDRDSQQQTQAMIEIVRLRTGLHEYESAVRWFADQPWPEDLLGRTAVQLYYAGLLRNYLAMYISEIGQRQPVV
ncbi:MAG: hypothetical protein QHH07_11905, partial [Sedimentisphaerales bacterium]|nr:hypothetical protein [Sedimentisphaerales bacterium]